MVSQEELISNPDLQTDEIPGIEFTVDELNLLAVAEGNAFYEWERVCVHLGFSATAEEIPDVYDNILKIEGRWDQEYVPLDEINSR